MIREQRGSSLPDDMIERLDHSGESNGHTLEAPKTSAEHVLRLEEPAADKRRFSKFELFALSCLAVLLVGFLAMGGVLWILFNQSVSNEQVRAQIEAQLTSVLGQDHTALVGETKVAIGHGGLLSIDASDVKILQGETTSLGVASEVGLKIKPFPLLTGNVVAESVTMRRASIAVGSLVSELQDQSLRPIWPGSINLKAGLHGLGQTISDLAEQIENAGLESVNLEDANLVGLDQLGLRSRTTKIQTLSVERTDGTGGQADLKVDALVETDFSDWVLTGSWTKGEDGQSKLDLDLSGLNVKDLLGEAAVADVNHEISLNFAVAFGSDGEPQPAQVEVIMGPGTIPVGDKGLTAQLREAVVRFNLDPLSNQLNFSRSTVKFDGSEAAFTGAIRYPSSLQDSVSLQPAFRLDVTEFDAFGLVEGDDPPAGAVQVEGFLDPIRQMVVADSILITTPNGELSGDASIRMDGQDPHFKLALAVESMPVEEFKQFWPPMMAPETRKWISENLFGGQMKNSWVKLNFPPGMFGQDELYTKDNLAAQISIQSARLRNPGELPAIENAEGVVDILGNHTNITLTGGSADMANAGTLKVSKSTMKMGSYAIPLMPSRLDLNMSGPASALVKLASLEPLGFTNRLKIQPEQISGTASAEVEAHFLIGKKLQVDKKPWVARLKGKNISSKKPINGRKLTNANMTIVASPKEAKISGTARLNNVPVKLAVLENLDGTAASTSKIVMTLSESDRAKIGLDTGSVITGPVEASIEDLSDDRRRVETNLTAAGLNFPWIGWSKGKGISAKASFILREADGSTSFEKFNLKGQGFSAEGSFVVDKSGLRRANMNNIRLNQIDDFDVAVRRRGEGYEIDLSARTYDGRALIRSLLSAELKPSQSKVASIAVRGTIGRLLGFGGQSLNNVDIDFQQKGKTVSRVVINARAASNAPTRFAMGTSPGGTQLEIATENAGSLLRFLDLYSKIRGGSITANLNRDNSQTFRGRITTTDFDLLNEPRLAQLLQRPRPSPDLNNGDAVIQSLRNIKTDQARVDQLQANIEKGPGFLNISKGRLWGGDAGAAFDGVVYDRNNRMNIKGTFLPGRGLNQLASKIPILGLSFGKGKVNGLLGITFQLYGRFDNPSLRVNPLSLIVPGMFRQIFRF